jgi:hypothetical protein
MLRALLRVWSKTKHPLISSPCVFCTVLRTTAPVLQRFAHIEATYQQLMEQQQAAQAEARQMGSSHAAELRQLRAQLAEREADCARLAAAEELYKKRNEELYKQVGVWVCKSLQE